MILELFGINGRKGWQKYDNARRNSEIPSNINRKYETQTVSVV
jgi:hypothetical protein